MKRFNYRGLRRRIAVGVCLSLAPISVAAATLTANPPASPVVSPTASPTGSTVQRLSNLKTRGAAEINRRLTSLTKAQAALTAGTTLTATNKDALSKQIQDESTGLTALNTKLAAETALAGARADVASVVSDYRVYVLMAPKVRLVTASDRADVATTALQALAGKLSTNITAAQTAGQTTDSLKLTLSDLNGKITDATTKNSGLVDKLLAVQPSDYNSSHTVLASYRQTLTTIDSDLQTARDDAQKIITVLKGLK